MSGADVFAYVGAGAGWIFLIGRVTDRLRERACRADLRRARSVAYPLARRVMAWRLVDRGPTQALWAEASASIPIEDLALMARFNFDTTMEALVAPRLKEVQAWRDRRRFRPWLCLAAFVRSAALG